MTDDSTTQCLLFAGVAPKPIFFRFDDPLGSSDGGAILLKAADSKLGLSDRLAECVRDERGPGKVKHEIADLIVQRVMALACGYAHCNGAGRLPHGPRRAMRH